MNGTHCSQIGQLGPFCSEFLSVNGTHCSQIGQLRPFCSEFLSVNGTDCSQIGQLGPFCFEFLSVNGTHRSVPNWSIRTVLFRVPNSEWNILFLNWRLRNTFLTILFRTAIWFQVKVSFVLMMQTVGRAQPCLGKFGCI